MENGSLKILAEALNSRSWRKNVIFVKEVFHGINAFEVACCIRSRKEKNIRRKHNSSIDMYIT